MYGKKDETKVKMALAFPSEIKKEVKK